MNEEITRLQVPLSPSQSEAIDKLRRLSGLSRQGYMRALANHAIDTMIVFKASPAQMKEVNNVKLESN